MAVGFHVQLHFLTAHVCAHWQLDIEPCLTSDTGFLARLKGSPFPYRGFLSSTPSVPRLRRGLEMGTSHPYPLDRPGCIPSAYRIPFSSARAVLIHAYAYQEPSHLL